MNSFLKSTVAACFAVLACQPAAKAALTLTQDGIDAGLVLTTFLSGVPNNFGIGPISYVNDPASSGVLVSSFFTNHLYRFATNADNQTFSAGVPSTQIYGSATGLAVLGGYIYAADQSNGAVSKVNGSGDVLGLAGFVSGATGLVGSAATGLLYVSGSAGVSTINPTTGAINLFKSGSGFDGLSTNSDGTLLFAEQNGHVYGYQTSNGSQVFDSGFINGADGALVANLAGTPVLFVNTNFGELWQVNLANSAQTLIASGGSRGDIAALDTTNNTALLTQTSTIVRLALPQGSTFGVSEVPEPASLSLLGLGLLVLGRMRRRG